MEKDVPYIVYESEAARHERTVKNLLKAEEMSGDNEYSSRGYSRRMSYDEGSYYPEERFVRPDGSYARGRGSGAKRDSMGRYSSESVDDHTKEKLREMIENL